jgi:hypothetical protein
MQIRIVRRPIGEAPEWVRDAWIGTCLPLANPKEKVWLGFGVLTRPRGRFAQLWGLFLGKAERITGYAVNAQAAVDVLSDSQPDAAGWWRANVPDMLDGRSNFVFDSNACEVCI